MKLCFFLYPFTCFQLLPRLERKLRKAGSLLLTTSSLFHTWQKILMGKRRGKMAKTAIDYRGPTLQGIFLRALNIVNHLILTTTHEVATNCVETEVRQFVWWPGPHRWSVPEWMGSSTFLWYQNKCWSFHNLSPCQSRGVSILLWPEHGGPSAADLPEATGWN